MKKFTTFKKYITRKLSLSPTKTGDIGKSSSADLNANNSAAACKLDGGMNITTHTIPSPLSPYWVMLITANVGTVFEYADEESETWFEQLRLCIAEHKPMFVALHFQEMGGKRFASIRSAAPTEPPIPASPVRAGKVPHHHRTPSTAAPVTSHNTDHAALTITHSNSSLPANMSSARLNATNANYELIEKFTARLVHKFGLCGYDPALVLVDSEFDNQKSFTALGNYYFLRVADAPHPHASLSIPSPNMPSGCLLPPFSLSLWNFRTQSFEQLACGDNNNVGNQSVPNDTSTDLNSTQFLTSHQTSDEDDEFRWLNTTPAQMYQCRQYYEKVRFSPSFFTHSRWSRKGFMRTRWRFSNGLELDLCNVHLFHNVSNIESMQSPSIYAQSRSRALYYVLSRIYSSYSQTGATGSTNQSLESQNSSSTTASPLPSTSENAELDQFIQRINSGTLNRVLPANVLLAMFGDFNFRIDLKFLLDELLKMSPPYAVRSIIPEPPPPPDAVATAHTSDRDRTVIVTRNDVDVLKIGPKIFSFFPPNVAGTTTDDTLRQLFRAPNAYLVRGDSKKTNDNDPLPDLRRFDNELEQFKKVLFEYERHFGPTYPLSEAIDRPHEYLGNRPPSWCDRVFLGTSTMNNLLFRGDDAACAASLTRHRQSAPAVRSYSNNSRGNAETSANTARAEEQQPESCTPEYDVIGRDVCMGDHKPVFLHIPLMTPSDCGRANTSAAPATHSTNPAVVV